MQVRIMDKILIKLYVPSIEERYDIRIPLNKRVSEVIFLLIKAIDEFCGGSYKPEQIPHLYNLLTEEVIDADLKVRDANIKNGMQLLLI